MNLFDLVAKITLDDKEYKKGVAESTKSGATMGQKIATGAKTAGKALAGMYTAAITVGAALLKLTLNSADYLGEIDDQAQKLNMSTDAYQKWSQAIKMSGSDIGTMSMGMKTFIGILDNAANGQADALLTLEKLGLGYADFQGLSVEDSFKKVVEQFQGMEQGAKKTQLAVDIFGRSGQELLPLFNQQVGWLDEMFESYENLGLIVSEDAVKAGAKFGDELDLLKQKFKIIGVNIGTLFMPAVSNVIGGLMSMASGSKDAGAQLQSGITSAIDTVISYLPKIGEFAAMIIPLIVDTVIATLPSLLDAAFQIVYTLGEMLVEYLPTLIPAAIGLILMLVETVLDNLPMLIDLAIDIIMAVVDGLINALPMLIEAAPKLILSLIDGIVQALPKLIDAAISIIMALVEYLLKPDTLGLLIKAAIEIMVALGMAFIKYKIEIIKIIPKLIIAIAEAFMNTDWAEVGKNILKGIGDGIKNAVGGVVETAKNAAKSIYDGVKGFFGINSPSRLMRDEIGKYIPQGIAVGVEEEMPEAGRDIRHSIEDYMPNSELINGFNGALKMNSGNSNSDLLDALRGGIKITIGNREIEDWTFDTVSRKMQGKGLKNLELVGGYSTK